MKATPQVQSLFPAFLFAGLTLHSFSVFAGTEPQAARQANANTSSTIQLTIDERAKPNIRLEAKDKPLEPILNTISEKTGALLHYSKLSDTPVSVSCEGENVTQIMSCLANSRFSMITAQPEKNKPTEFWLVGSCEENCLATNSIMPPKQAVEGQQPEYTPEEQAKVDQSLKEQSDLLLKQAQSKDPVERGQALYNLGLAGLKDDPDVDAALRTGLADKNPNIRAQAVTAIAQRGGEGAEVDLGQALNDRDVNVRFNAVSGINDNVDLLQRASNDRDKGVRELAIGKLADLNPQQSQ